MPAEAATGSVSIVGCGWYGWPLAKRLKSLGWTVKGSKSTREGAEKLRADGVEGYPLHLDPLPTADVEGALFEADVLVLNIPPRRRPDVESYYLAQMEAVRGLIEDTPVHKVVFISATSVYPDVNGTVTEQDDLQPQKPAGKALKRAEAFWRRDPQVRTTVLRFAGLVGGDRDPGRFLAGKRDLDNGDAPVNLIHLDDCIDITVALLDQDVWDETFNACCPGHPPRRVFYPAAARKSGLEEPTFSGNPSTAFKLVDSEKLRRRLGYTFKHPDPSAFP